LTQIIKITLPTPFKVGPVNIYLIKGNAITLVDTGPRTKEAWNLLHEELKRNHLQIKDIDQILLTHHHTDHVGLVDELLQMKEMKIYSHPLGGPYLQKEPSFIRLREQFYADLYRLHGVPQGFLDRLRETFRELDKYNSLIKVDHYLREGDLLPSEEDWEILETPGHAPDHISLYHRKSHELIGGDHLIKHISSNAFVEPGYGDLKRPRSLLVYREALQKLLKLPIKKVYSGHGEEIDDAHSLIRERISKQDERANQIHLLLNQPSTAFELSKQMFPHLYINELPLTMSEIIGHLDLLLEREQVKVNQIDETYIFHAAAGINSSM